MKSKWGICELPNNEVHVGLFENTWILLDLHGRTFELDMETRSARLKLDVYVPFSVLILKYCIQLLTKTHYAV